jgi:hypothetical protein
MLFMNEMLLTSWIFSSLLASSALIHVIPCDKIRQHWIRLPVVGGGFLALTFLFKMGASVVLRVQDDVRRKNRRRARSGHS